MDHTNLPVASARAAAMRLFALAPWELLKTETRTLDDVRHDILRGPETGLVMLRGRMGATGSAFNFGEATVTRCAVRLASGTEGHAYVRGRNGEQARRAALCDALFQDQPATMKPLLETLDRHLKSESLQAAGKAAATKVDFFTMVRGDD
jgi:alpha-D-ribose 1-methylphosphonate 5-triphosphate synthase subunit PhnG